ncbi:hypothetical protein quinque_016219 [Culex quinquefasciatus]
MASQRVSSSRRKPVPPYRITSSSSLPSLGGAGVGGGGTGYSVASGGADKPYFDDVNSRNVTAIVEDTAVLRCRVKHKGDRTPLHNWPQKINQAKVSPHTPANPAHKRGLRNRKECLPR